MESTTEAYSFKQLFTKKRKDYYDANDFNKKKKIINKYICDQEVSNNFLDILSKHKVTKELLNTFETYFNSLKYSLNVQENSKYYNFLQDLCNKLKYKTEMKKYEYLSQNDPINNFTKIIEHYSKIESINNYSSDNEIKQLIDNIDKYIDELKNVYNYALKEFYFPPNQIYPIYAYNYYSYKIFNILKKLQTVKRVKIFKTTNDKILPSGISSKKRLYIQINSILSNFASLFQKFSYNNIEKDLIVLKIVTLYLTIFEKSREFYSIFDEIKEVSACLNSTPINSDILNIIEIYRENSNTPVKPEEWDSIGLNENIYVKNFDMLKTKIKRFNNSILKCNIAELDAILTLPKISHLNMNALINYSLIKSNKEIENYSILLIKKIFSSKIYIHNFVKYDKRFSHKKQKILQSIFYGANKDEIFKEIWENIIFIPMPKQRLSGPNNRPQYTIFINSKHNFNLEPKFDKVIPIIHCEINAIFREITHNIALLLAANLNEDDFDTVIIDNNNDLNELQNKYYTKYAQNSIKYKKFDDFGDLMEVVLYGIRPRIFRTFSSLFCLNLDSYNISEDNFRDTCLNLYQSQITIEKDVIENIINNVDVNEKLRGCEGENQNQKGMELITNLLKSKISKLLSESFLIDNAIQNESYIEDENPRNMLNYIFNDEYVIEIDYYDKLD